MHRFEVYEDSSGFLRWRLRADNHQTIAVSSEGYSSHNALQRSIEVVREGGSTEVYEDKAGEWRWRLRATNGNIIATGGEGYVAKSDCEAGLAKALSLAHSADVVQEQTA